MSGCAQDSDAPGVSPRTAAAPSEAAAGSAASVGAPAPSQPEAPAPAVGAKQRRNRTLYVGPPGGCQGFDVLERDARVAVEGPVPPDAVRNLDVSQFEAAVIDVDVGDEAFDVLLQLSEAGDPCRSVVVGSGIGRAMVREVFLAGAVACLRNPVNGPALCRAVAHACESTLMMRQCMETAGVESMPLGRRALDISALTPREREIMQLLLEGRTTPSMADLLDVRPRTVKFHVSNLLRKLGVGSRLSLLAKLGGTDTW